MGNHITAISQFSPVGFFVVLGLAGKFREYEPGRSG
jgi:hypothetical protein